MANGFRHVVRALSGRRRRRDDDERRYGEKAHDWRYYANVGMMNRPLPPTPPRGSVSSVQRQMSTTTEPTYRRVWRTDLAAEDDEDDDDDDDDDDELLATTTFAKDENAYVMQNPPSRRAAAKNYRRRANERFLRSTSRGPIYANGLYEDMHIYATAV